MNCSYKRKPEPRIILCHVPRGTTGTLTTAKMIAQLVCEGAKDFLVRQKTINVFRRYRIPAKDRFGEVCAVFDWVRRNIRYTRDILGTELLHTARRMLELRAGDCDDMTILLGAMLRATGHPIRLVLVGFRPSRPHIYTHIYPEVNVSGKWIPIDATVKQPMGWAPPALWKRTCEVTRGDITCV